MVGLFTTLLVCRGGQPDADQKDDRSLGASEREGEGESARFFFGAKSC
ncbi:hypothetical protein CyaNS01_01432 [Cyanobium sp. NS01]|nr:hypothetical protein CyaNS01_01432 [Cyanobium sp. NS01]